ncbi:MAG: acetyl-CoA C-acyltransferase [Candidatus Dormibacteraeota bacterium]|nr:acetyl-CoA C-acyltransferase [Candidatus Dormibacteraeota bacterium]MBV8445332.1 acetyl-CoA C-acyltransferase [Candidatus Dormibacteraeota bacterium]
MNVYILDACRTPVGRFRGALSSVRPDDLAAVVIAALLQRNPAVHGEDIEDVWFGASNQAGEDNRNVARMASLLAGLPVSVPGATVNRLCSSGLQAINIARAELAAHNGSLAIAGGVESMTRAPFVMPKPDAAFPREQRLFDTTIGWRMTNPAMPPEHTLSMGETAEVLAREYEISREAQDEFALRSHQRAVAAQTSGAFDSELIPVPVRSGTSETVVRADEGPRPDATLESLAKLQPAFVKDGTVTAGNSSPLNDGAAACLLATDGAVERLGLQPVVRIVATAVAGVEPRRMGIGPVPAMHKALQRAGWALDDLAVVELNEAFAAQSLAVLRDLPIDASRVNPLGGAIALGHPIGCSGARIMTTLLHQLRPMPSGTRGAATMCVGVGQGVATLVERV